MIHTPQGSAYDGYFERVADRIAAVLTDQTRETILRLKYEILGDRENDGYRILSGRAARRSPHLRRI